MELHSKAPDIFIPKFNENQENPKSEQIKIWIKYPSVEEYSRFGGFGKTIDEVGLVKFAVTKIENLKCEGKQIESGEDLANANRALVWPLVTEIFGQILIASGVEEEDEKNSEGQSNSI